MHVALHIAVAFFYSLPVTSISDWPWLKFIPLLAAFTIAICEAFTRKTERRWLHRLLVPLLSALMLVASCWIVWSDDKTARESKAGEDLHLDRIEGKLGDEEATKRYVDGVASLTRQLTTATTGSAVEKFFGSASERQKLRDEVQHANQKLLSAYEIRMNPVSDYVIAKIDNWLAEVRKRGIKVEVTKNEVPPVSIDVQKSGTVREAVFENGDKILVEFYSARIIDGRLSGNFHCQIPFISGKGRFQAGEVFGLNIDEKQYTIANTRPSRFVYKPYEGKAENPIEDQLFITRLDQALDEVMAFVVEEATATK
jgi:hypothetical protein